MRMWIQLFMPYRKRRIFSRRATDGEGVQEFTGELNVLFSDTLEECNQPQVTEKCDGQQFKAVRIPLPHITKCLEISS